MKRQWLSILHHVLDVNSWTDEDGAQQCCTHEPLSEEVWKKKKWFEAGSPDYNDLSSLIQDKRLLKNFKNMGLFKHTGDICTLH